MGQRALQGGANEEAPAREKESSKRGGGHCTMLVRHLGAVLGLRGREAYRRPGPGQPVWRKRETLIQERIVQYTTLDEEGTVRFGSNYCRVFPLLELTTTIVADFLHLATIRACIEKRGGRSRQRASWVVVARNRSSLLFG